MQGTSFSKPSSAEKLREAILEILWKYRIKGRIFLDIGGGTGEFTADVAKSIGAEEIYLVDINDTALKKAEKRGIKCFKIDVSKEPLPFQDDYFDVITAIEVIEHLYDPDHAILEAKRCIKPGAFFILSTPNLAWWANRLALLLGYQPYFSASSARFNVGKMFRRPSKGTIHEHIRLFTRKALLQLLSIYGFVVWVVKGAPGTHDSKMLSFVDNIISRIPSLEAETIVIATKRR
jgi:ubiquinone/menaquinone biosynthesis C-methylase UbiE